MDPAMLQQLQALQGGGRGGRAAADADLNDTAETVYISSLALLKMIQHGKRGVPFEVMGLMLGDFVDKYTVAVKDVFAMPQRGTSMTVEAVDPVFQQQMLEMLKQTGRPEAVVGWYHSHPGWGCWLSGVDVNTQQSFEALNKRAVAVVVDPVISVKGKVAISAFRTINPQAAMLGLPTRQTTSVVGHLAKPSIQALMHGLNRGYYGMVISFRKNDMEVRMLQNLNRLGWKEGLRVKDVAKAAEHTAATTAKTASLIKGYAKRIEEELKKSEEELVVASAGRVDEKRRLGAAAESLMVTNIATTLGAMVAAVVF